MAGSRCWFCRLSIFTSLGRRLGSATSMVLLNWPRLLLTACSIRVDPFGSRWPPVPWRRHCCNAAPKAISRMRAPRSTGWQRCRPIPASFSMRSRCCGCTRCWRGRTATRQAIATIGIATARWRHRLASRGISSGPRRCHDGGHRRLPVSGRSRSTPAPATTPPSALSVLSSMSGRRVAGSQTGRAANARRAVPG